MLQERDRYIAFFVAISNCIICDIFLSIGLEFTISFREQYIYS